MKHFKHNEAAKPDFFINVYGGISKNEFDKHVNDLLLKDGYILNEGTTGEGVYTKGNRAMRILFGAFVKYYKFNIKTESSSEDEVKLTVVKSSSGMSGGVIGVNQVKKELIRLADVFTAI